MSTSAFNFAIVLFAFIDCCLAHTIHDHGYRPIYNLYRGCIPRKLYKPISLHARCLRVPPPVRRVFLSRARAPHICAPAPRASFRAGVSPPTTLPTPPAFFALHPPTRSPRNTSQWRVHSFPKRLRLLQRRPSSMYIKWKRVAQGRKLIDEDATTRRREKNKCDQA